MTVFCILVHWACIVLYGNSVHIYKEQVSRNVDKIQLEIHFHTILNLVMNLAMMSLALRGHCDHTVSDDDCHGGNLLALVAMQPGFYPVLQDLIFTGNRSANSEAYEREHRKRKQAGFSFKLVNVITEITQHSISFTLFGTLVISGTPQYDL